MGQRTPESPRDVEERRCRDDASFLDRRNQGCFNPVLMGSGSVRRSKVRRRSLIALVIAVITFALSIIPSAPGFSVDTYYPKNTMLAGQTANSGWNYWTVNEVWRPVSYTFAAWYDNSSTQYAGYTSNTWNNPFIASGPYGYSRGFCANLSGVAVYPVTCQVHTQ